MTEFKAQNRFLDAIAKRTVDRPPIWVMRQAGRYLPEYRAIRKKAKSFLTLCKTPELACEVTLQPLRRFALDAAIVFSDILCMPDAMGLGLYFIEGEGPKLQKKIRDRRDIEALPIPDPTSELRYTLDAIKLIKQENTQGVPLIGFVGSPWTVMCYMVEGETSRDYTRPRALIHQDPVSAHALLAKLAKAHAEYLNAQISAGADVVMIFDTWGGLLSHQNYIDFSLRYMQDTISMLQRHVPVILFSKGCGAWAADIAKSGCDVMGLDWRSSLGEVRKKVGGQIALQGNLDPTVLLAGEETIREKVHAMLKDFGPYPGHIVNLGHGIQQTTPPEAVQHIIESVESFFKAPR